MEHCQSQTGFKIFMRFAGFYSSRLGVNGGKLEL